MSYCHVLKELERREQFTRVEADKIRRQLTIFPPWQNRPKAVRSDTDHKQYIYNKEEWAIACSAPAQSVTAGATGTLKRTRQAGPTLPNLAASCGGPLAPIQISKSTSGVPSTQQRTVPSATLRPHAEDSLKVAGTTPPCKRSSSIVNAGPTPPCTTPPCKRQLGVSPTCLRLKSKTNPLLQHLPVWQVSTQLQHYVHTFTDGSEDQWNIQAREAGGAGDCLYFSVAAVLLRMLHSGNSAAVEHAQASFPQGRLPCDLQSTMEHLRQIAASDLLKNDKWTDEDILNYTLQCDTWLHTPTQVLRMHAFGQLVEGDIAELVQGVGPVCDGNPTDVKVSLRRASSADEDFIVPQGREKLLALRHELQDNFQRTGNYHWGNHRDM